MCPCHLNSSRSSGLFLRMEKKFRLAIFST
jgi:hypothetical protein